MTIPPVVARIFSGDSTSPLTREARTWCGARDYCPFAMVVGMEKFGATGGASSSPTKSEGDSANTKLYKHTQTLALRKVGGIVRMQNKWNVH